MSITLFVITFFILGLLIGSFLNVVIFRLETEDSWAKGRSRCQTCRKELSWYDNIPLVSFLFLGGKCRFCKQKLSWQYPLVEGITALCFTGAAFLFFTLITSLLNLAVFLSFLTLICFCILICVYDLRFSLIPNSFLWGINISTLIFLLLFWFVSVPENGLYPPSPTSSILGALVAGGFFYLLVRISQETWMGWGDVWLGVWGGLFIGIELTQVFITLSFTLGAFVGLGMLYWQKKTLKTEIPFAPYILLSGFTIFFLIWWYPDIFHFLSPWLPGTIQ